MPRQFDMSSHGIWCFDIGLASLHGIAPSFITMDDMEDADGFAAAIMGALPTKTASAINREINRRLRNLAIKTKSIPKVPRPQE
jgi:hypothetical protein